MAIMDDKNLQLMVMLIVAFAALIVVILGLKRFADMAIADMAAKAAAKKLKADEDEDANAKADE